ncbi:MAG TPA: Isoquinoline 1-oxidoreductase subunit [Kofleriaceae bacterium]|nr:Isoquinoline 1-oxidoreductase subunit [Kofleriaceae bacterium]
MQQRLFVAAAVSVTVGCGGGSGGSGRGSAPVEVAVMPPVAANELRDVTAFSAIGDRATRSRALFAEMSRVLMHPRCVNCHPDGNVPHQGMDLVFHDPPVLRGGEDRGVVGMECGGCHQDRNQELTRMPGAPEWHLAPIEMAWVGKSAGYICAQMKDPKRNGGKTLEQIVEHNGHDELVGWGWAPGAGREPAPGTQQQFGALSVAWLESGAECPDDVTAKER